VTGGVHYFFLEVGRQKRASAVERLERESSSLRSLLLQLSGGAKSIVGLADGSD